MGRRRLHPDAQAYSQNAWSRRQTGSCTCLRGTGVPGRLRVVIVALKSVDEGLVASVRGLGPPTVLRK